MKKQGGCAQSSQEMAFVRLRSFEQLDVPSRIVWPKIFQTLDSQFHEHTLGWNCIVNSSGTPE